MDTPLTLAAHLTCPIASVRSHWHFVNDTDASHGYGIRGSSSPPLIKYHLSDLKNLYKTGGGMSEWEMLAIVRCHDTDTREEGYHCQC